MPIIPLTSNPPVPDSEKLSWLVLGQGLEHARRAAISPRCRRRPPRSSARTAGPCRRRSRNRIGLDDISFKSGTAPARNARRGTPDATGQVVVVGKRLTERLSLVYEQGLTVATNALRLEYSLTSSLSVRAEAGTVSGVGLFYRKNF